MVAKSLYRIIEQVESDSSLFDPDQLRKRLDLLDELDASLANAEPESSIADSDNAAAYERVTAIRTRLEALNAAIYQSIRAGIQQSAGPYDLIRWIERCGYRNGIPRRGLSYDRLDELISGVLQLRKPDNPHIYPSPDMVFYQPTPARHILYLIGAGGLSEADVFVDLGSGLGHVPILVSLLTGAGSIGIELEPAYIASARDCAHILGLGRVTFVQQDAIEADLSTGTVFYLYTPFIGASLRTVLLRLRRESASRTIRLCTLGPCTGIIAKQRWLTAAVRPDPERITYFQSCV
jgi:hypothetical protein